MVGPILLEDAKPVPPELEKYLSQGVKGDAEAFSIIIATFKKLNRQNVSAFPLCAM